MAVAVAPKQKPTNRALKSCTRSMAAMSQNSMTGKVTRNTSLSAAAQKAGGRKPSRRSPHPAAMTRNTGSVALTLKIRFSIGYAPPFCTLCPLS